MQKLIKELNSILNKSTFNLKNQKISFEKIGLDSLDIMTLILAVQEKYNIKTISDSDYESLKSLNDIYLYLISKKKIKQ